MSNYCVTDKKFLKAMPDELMKFEAETIRKIYNGEIKFTKKQFDSFAKGALSFILWFAKEKYKSKIKPTVKE